MIDYAALDKAATAAPWSDAGGAIVGGNGYALAEAWQEADAALIVALRNGIANGDLIPRSEVDALVTAARDIEVYGDGYVSNADYLALRAALAPFEVRS